MEQKSDSWEGKFNELQNKYESLSTVQDALKKENDELKNKLSTTKSTVKIEHSGDFWQDIEVKILSDPDYIKMLVKNKVMTMFDTDPFGKTLLINTAWRGAYELVQFCINSGADIDAKDNKNKTALDRARENGYYHVEQLLLFSQMNANIGNEIKHTTDIMHKQNGINYNISNELSLIGKQTKELFEKTLMELMINIINKRLSFSDNLLNLCWIIASRENDPLSSDLWKTISSTCFHIIQNGGKRDWYWLKTCVITSTIWFKDIGIQKEEKKSQESDKTHYLYYELLKLVDIEAKNQLNKLEQDLNILANENKNNWDKLTKWDMPDEYEKVRQDVIPNGIVSRYTYNQLSESSGATFNSPKFYDYNQYLSQLVLLAQIVDDEFQRSAQEMFKIDKVTHEGIIKFNNNIYNNEESKKDNSDIGDGKIKYMRGPVKLIERARNKAQNDYANEEYPASACIMDLNRCALIFNDISTLLTALELFMNKVKYYQSGNIIGIVRDKNGFIEYVKQTQYADIKLNVLIKGKHNNIIGEVQFLLKTMKEFKDKAHNLYAIQRQQESIESSVSKVLPMLLDEDKQLFIAGNRGNVKDLCQLIVVNNKSMQDVMKTDKTTRSTILHSICSFGHDKAFLFIESMLSKEAFIKYALTTNLNDTNPTEFSVRKGRVFTAKHLFDIEEIKQYYKKKNQLFRLFFHLFVFNPNTALTDYILNLLNITTSDAIEMMNYEYQRDNSQQFASNAVKYRQHTIMTGIAFQSMVFSLKKLISVIGEKAFCDAAFRRNIWNENALQSVIEANKLEMMKYMMDVKDIKHKCLNDMDELHSIVAHLNSYYHEPMVLYIIKVLDLTEAKLTELQSYSYIDITKILSVIQR